MPGNEQPWWRRLKDAKARAYDDRVKHKILMGTNRDVRRKHEEK
jgi:hypothetical protein